MSKFLGASSRFTTDLSLTLPSHYEPMPCFRLTSPAGQLLAPYDIPHSPHLLRRMYSTMIYTSTMDAIFYDAQRQGRISFYMTNYGITTYPRPQPHSAHHCIVLPCYAHTSLLCGCVVRRGGESYWFGGGFARR